MQPTLFALILAVIHLSPSVTSAPIIYHVLGTHDRFAAPPPDIDSDYRPHLVQAPKVEREAKIENHWLWWKNLEGKTDPDNPPRGKKKYNSYPRINDETLLNN